MSFEEWVEKEYSHGEQEFGKGDLRSAFHAGEEYFLKWLLSGELLTELKTLLETRSPLGVNTQSVYPYTHKMVQFLDEQSFAPDENPPS